MTNRVALSDFASQCRRHLKEGAEDELIIVMGNEAGDLDSAASAIGFAYLSKYATSSLTDKIPKGTHLVPLLQTLRGDLILRPENQLVFQLCQLLDTSLTCLDDVPPSFFTSESKVRFGLVDHNAMSAAWGQNRRVVAVVDHHDDEGKYKEDVFVRRVQVPVGSCSSLVTNLFEESLQREATLPQGDRVICRHVIDLLISAIIIDTDNMQKKVEEADEKAFSLLYPLSSLSVDGNFREKLRAACATGSPGLVQMFEREKPIRDLYGGVLLYSKVNVDHFESRDLLRRDYKEYVVEEGKKAMRLGISTVPVGLNVWLKRDSKIDRPRDYWAEFWRNLDSYMTERSLDIAVVLNSFRDEKDRHRRELIMCMRPRPNENKSEIVWETFKRGLEGEKELILKEWMGKNRQGEKITAKGLGRDSNRLGAVYHQKNAHATRKQVAPIAVQWMKQALRSV